MSLHTNPDELLEPIRAELFSIERLEQHAESLAAAQTLAPKKTRGRTLLPRVKDNARVLRMGYQEIAQAVHEERVITPAAEWLVDNFHIVEEQIREIVDDLPPGYYKELPKLDAGHLQGYPRIFGVAWAFVAHTDSRMDPEWLRRFVKAYQRPEPLHIGEIWALAISFRIILVENLRRMTERIVASKIARQKANELADALLGLKGATASPDLTTFEKAARSRAFAVQLVQRLRDQEGRVDPALQWLDRQLALQQTTADDIVRVEHQAQASMNTTVRNVVTSMRMLSAMDWAQFFEDVSVVDEILRAESNFAGMDFPTRDLYRHAIEELSRGSEWTEVEVTHRALSAAKTAGRVVNHGTELEEARLSDPGYYLISRGRIPFEKRIGFRVSLKRRLLRLYIKFATPAYLGTLTLFTGAILAVPLLASLHAGADERVLALLGLLGLIPASDLAVALVNRLVTESLGPKALPKLDFKQGIPAEHPTLLVIPVLLTNQSAVLTQLEHLEIHYLSNPEGHLQFGLLSDWMDAPEEHRSEDDALLATARKGIQRLNERYPWTQDPNQKRFYLFHRRRFWNPSESVWMGWERKRGKLAELHRLLRGYQKHSFVDVTEVPQAIRYIITLDADTRLARGTAYQMAAAMAHPLNRPRFDPVSGRVVEGYGLMQPRITPTLPTEGFGSPYQRIYSGPAGIDPYAFAVSDVYQDLFREGSYVGKGIYDIDAFDASLADRVPENALLSHDLLEGLFTRTALVTEIELFEEFPAHYEVAVARSHRWVRGDWQLLPWLLGKRSQGPHGKLPWIGRWKIVDNLRRSLVAPTAYLTLIIAWLLGMHPTLWTLFVAMTLALPYLLPVVLHLFSHRRQISWRLHFDGVWTDFKLALVQSLMALTFLPHQAWVMVDAITRTLYRLLISRKRLLQWTSAELSKNQFDTQLNSFYAHMANMAPLVIFPAAWLIVSNRPWPTSVAGFAISLLWLFCPWMAQRLSLPAKEDPAQLLSSEDQMFFRCIARMTWRFFETFVTQKHHFLPPDNFQEIPAPVEAHRTSPTNIGLYLLSVVAARKFGWIGVNETAERLETTFATVKVLKQHQGHLFNWYDTLDLRPLDPLYISTVDSGNLAGHLWAVSSACRALASQPLERTSLFLGFEDVLILIDRAVASIDFSRRTEMLTGTQLEDALREMHQAVLQNRSASAQEVAASLAALEKEAVVLTDMAATLTGSGEVLAWCELLTHQIKSHRRDFATGERVSLALNERLLSLAREMDAFVQNMQFAFLSDPVKKIFSIGYQMAEQKLDSSYYDLLASEARLASFVAIAKGDLPALHWFQLSRSLVPVPGGLALLSWSGSMFEYLMPSLVMHPPLGSLLDQTCRNVVRRQIAYGEERHVPWGISEAGYNAQDLEFTYQYSNFGVPGLGLKRGLSEDVVIAPYATVLASMVAPVTAAKNLRRLADIGAEGRYGFYESLDYTPKRLPEEQKVAIVQEYMAHHQGMSLVALANVLCQEALRHYFHSKPQVQATELLLQERTPRDIQTAQPRSDDSRAAVRSLVPPVLRRFYSPHDVLPRTHLLSNGRYSVMVTAAGSGYSRWRHLAVTRWREDTTRDASGTYIFLRDIESGKVWSAGFQPSGAEPDRYEVDFSEDRAEIIRHDGDFITTLEVVVSPEDDAEIRRVTLKNTGNTNRQVEITSYAEIVLATPAADQAHPAFSNLFIQTEFVAEVSGLLCTRRPRAPEEPTYWAAHVVVVDGDTVGDVEYESDRLRFLGRGRGIRTPACVIDGKPLSNTAGPVLDPIVSLRRAVQLKPGETVRVIFSTMVASSRDEIMGLADKYHDLAMFERTVTLAWTQAHIQQYHLGMEPSEAHLFQDLASRVLYSQNGLRATSEILSRNERGAPGLWAYGISGDLPIVLIRIDEEDDRDIVREILRAHQYWRMKNLAVDLVILNEKASSYTQELQTTLEAMVLANQETLRQETQMPHGSIFVMRGDRLSLEDRALLLSVARVILLSRQGTLSQQVSRLDGEAEKSGSFFFQPSEAAQLLKDQADTFRDFLRSTPRIEKELVPKTSGLQFFNGLGGFSEDGREYVITLYPGQWTPAPWINVIANREFGFQVSESGSGYTWAMNSRENQLTSWSNDPVSDPAAEVFYIRDEETGALWTPTALPIREETASYTATHGQGYSRFDHLSHGVRSELLQFVPLQDPIKISRLRLTNPSKYTRRLSVTAYLEWTMGNSRAASVPFIVTERETETGALLARNAWNTEFAERIAFADLGGRPTSWTTDRTEFLGRNGTLPQPAVLLQKEPLRARQGAGLDPCAALQTVIELRPGASADIVFLVGQGANRKATLELIRQYRRVSVDAVFADVQRQWDSNLAAVQVRTPDRSMDLMLNRWLLYQTMVCRLWARAAFYQAGGAYGFRDQLQDVMAITVPRRDLAREHILRAAARQFKEGDVQHWWHPPTGRGVRTHISDDLAWLPFVVNHYLEVTGDKAILDETMPFLEGQEIAPGKEDAYFQPQTSLETATLFEHCCRALDRCLPVGTHGLPLMGSGDWNDGMNRVGMEGKGESIWLAWFLHTTLWEFAKVAESRGDTARAEKWRLHVGELKAALERNGWDGEWYRRAYFDDGTPVGSSTNQECQIDSIAQTWGVLSGAADPARATRAMAALEKLLVRPAEKLVLLFTPPFNHSKPNPGYIQGYLSGVRENGGQYTHAAVWAVFAFAALGDGDKAAGLFSMLNPINHGSSRADIQRYKVEPYVAAGDVYAQEPHTGRGGWTWYTGSAGWMYRAGIESILGFRLRGTTLFMDPCIPRSWPGFDLSFRYHSARYDVKVENPKGVSRGVQSVEVDGKPVRGGAAILLVDDRKAHHIRIVLG